jgi:TRAP-type C4-dicarboxylate transport system substrate-binding protein
MHRTMKAIALSTVLAGTLSLSAAGATASEIEKREFQVVGTWGNLFHWQEHESRFWNDILPKVSDGALTANARPLTELGLSGFELMRQLRLGAFDFAHGVTSYVAADSPAIEGSDLAAMVQDIGLYREVLNAYRPVLDREFEQRFNSKILVLYAWPSQQFYCNLGDKSRTDISLKDLRGKKIRTYNTTLGDFIEGVGGSAVTITFAEVVPALQRGVVDCGVTGTLPAYDAKWHQVATHNIRVRLGYVSSFLAVNLDVWNRMQPEARALFERELGSRVYLDLQVPLHAHPIDPPRLSASPAILNSSKAKVEGSVTLKGLGLESLALRVNNSSPFGLAK